MRISGESTINGSGEEDYPFSANYALKKKDVLSRNYYSPYFEADQEWRKIDNDWLDVAEGTRLKAG